MIRMVQQGVKVTKQKYLNSAVQRQEITKCERNGWQVEKKLRFFCVSHALRF